MLSGNVVLTQGENVTKGDKLVYDLKTGHATVTGKRVSGMFSTGNYVASPAVGADSGNVDTRRAGVRSSSR